MGSGTKSKGGIDMGSPGYNEDDWEAYRWCVRNNIAIAPKAYTEKNVENRYNKRRKNKHKSRNIWKKRNLARNF